MGGGTWEAREVALNSSNQGPSTIRIQVFFVKEDLKGAEAELSDTAVQ